MYETFYGFRKRPFLSSPTLDRYYPSEEMEKAFRTVAQSIERADGPVAIMGNSGTGKSLLGLRIADSWRKNYEVILLSSSKFCTRRALLQCLLFELRMPYREMSEGELRLSLQERLQLSMDNPSDGLILIVDEAQSLNLKLLEELRMLTNLARDGQPRVRLILIGSPRLDELLGHSRMESLSQRLSARCYLHALTYDESRRYIQHKVELGGVECTSVFTEDAIRSIHRAADGVPRLLDQIADHALRLGAASAQRPIAASTVEQAWAGLQQLPSPWTDALPIEPSSVIEYGPLDLDEENDILEFESMESSELPTNLDEQEETEGSFFPTFEPSSLASPDGMVESKMLDEIFQGSSAFISTNCYDLDEAVTIGDFAEHFSPSFDQVDEQLPVSFEDSQPSSLEMTPPTRAANPFGDDFDEEISISGAPSEPNFELTEVTEEYRLQPISTLDEPKAIQIEEIEDILHLDERAIENEIREMISSLHLSSSGLEEIDVETTAELSNETSTSAMPTTPATPESSEEWNLETIPTTGSQVLSFASLGSGRNKAIGDDRDLLVIEENLDISVADSDDTTVAGNSVDARTMHTPFSYVQLFSKLRS